MSILTEIRNEVSARYDKDIASLSQHAEVNIIRKAYCNALRAHYTLSQLGDSINRTHSSIVHYATTHNEDLKMEVYKSAYLYTKALYVQKTEKMDDSINITTVIQEVRTRLIELERMLQNHGSQL